METGEILSEQNFPDAETIYEVRFIRPDSKNPQGDAGSLLKATWYDGTERSYSAADGSLVSQTLVTPPDGSLREEFLTDRYRLVSLPGEPVKIYDRETEDLLGEFHEDANLAYVTQTGEYIILEYFSMRDGSRYGLVLNEKFETLAKLPGLCDILDQELIFDCGDGRIRSTRLFSLRELIDQALSMKTGN